MISFGIPRSKRLVALAGTASILYGVLFLTPQAANVALAADPTIVAVANSMLGEAITQIQSLMQSMSAGCSGGASGVPPVNWGALQGQGNAAVNAFQNARVALASGDMATVVQQINAGQASLNNLVNGAHDNCSGGAHGMDPVGYGSYQVTRATVNAKLDGAKPFLR
jgi:hypothetical protein